MLRTFPDLCSGMKTIIWSITHAHFPRPQGMHPQALALHSSVTQAFKGMREDEVLHVRLFSVGNNILWLINL